jgi:phage antirepressor YoqD-like protein|nr:MAG TPA: KilA protein [Caudoviricetes sp.]
MNTQIFQYNNNPVTFRMDGGITYVSATEMAKPFGKRPNDYLSLPSTNELVKAITRKSGIAENQLIKINRGGLNPATWLHEDVALDFAQWLSVDFRLWCLDRLKELLKYGITATQPTIETIIDDPDNAIKLLTALKQERAERQRLAEQNELHRQQLEMAAPKVQYYDTVLMSESTYNTNNIAKEFGMSAKTLNSILQSKGVQYRQGGQWLLYHKYQNRGFTKTHTYAFTRLDGSTGTSIQTVWTEAGRKFIHELLGD